MYKLRYLRKYGVPARSIDGASRPTYSIPVLYVCTRLREAGGNLWPSRPTTRWEEDSKGPHPIWADGMGVLRIVVLVSYNAKSLDFGTKPYQQFVGGGTVHSSIST